MRRAPDPILEFAVHAQLDVSAASGLAYTRGALAVVVDDALVLSRYDLDGRPLGTTQLWPGELPADPIERKRVKPDLESLVRLPDGSLLAVPSGSKRRRGRGAVIDGRGVREVDFDPLYAWLRRDFDRLNVEGAAMLGDTLSLFTRRTGARGRNTIVALRLFDALAALRDRVPRLGAAMVQSITEVALGEIDGVPLGLCDATEITHDEVLFSAAAEAVDEPTEDGKIVGCVVGRLGLRGRVRAIWRVEQRVKIEGLAVVRGVADGDWLYAVTDADDPTVLSPLLRAPLDRVALQR